jgi:hypothetical protein
MSFKEKFSAFIEKITPTINTKDGWFPFINNQLKWAVGFLIKTITLLLTLYLVILLVKGLQIASLLRSVVVKDALGIVPQGSTVTSSPDINYTGDLKSIDGVVKMLESKKKGTQKDEKANKKVVK